MKVLAKRLTHQIKIAPPTDGITPVILKPLMMLLTNHNSNPLRRNVKRPSVNILSGSVRVRRIGRMVAFNIPRTAAAPNAGR